jgi:hypothetical protein
MTDPQPRSQTPWNYRNTVRKGSSYVHCVERLTPLLFLKTAAEQSRPLFRHAAAGPPDIWSNSHIDREP